MPEDFDGATLYLPKWGKVKSQAFKEKKKKGRNFAVQMNGNTSQAPAGIIPNHELKKLGQLLSFTTELSVLPIKVLIACWGQSYYEQQHRHNNKSLNKTIRSSGPNT